MKIVVVGDTLVSADYMEEEAKRLFPGRNKEIDAIPKAPKLLVNEMLQFLNSGKNDMVVNYNRIKLNV